MIEIIITNEMIVSAKLKSDSVKFDSGKKSNRFGFEKNRTFVGYLGEQMVMQHLKTSVDIDDYEYDLIYNDIKIEVKTISCKFKPRLDYFCTVNSCNDIGVRKQSADYYIFTRILNDYSIGWILGYMKCDDFFKRGKYIEKGSEPINGLTFEKGNATVMPISELHLMKGDNALWVKDYEMAEKG